MEELKYTLNINSDTPIMLINDEIGSEGIDGAEFQKELLWLDSLGKKSIDIWINSIGGSVLDGYSIASSILKTKTPVDTYNVGLAASIAGVIWMCGRNRVMMDYSQLMMHPVSGTSDKKSKKSFESSLSKLLSAKSDLTQAQVSELMKETSWLDAEECLEKGFATRIENTAETNKKRLSGVSNVEEILKITNKIMMDEIPSKLKQEKSMLNVINKLGLAEDSNEEAILLEIENIENKAKLTADELDALKEEMDALKDKHTKEMDEMKQKIKDAKEMDCRNMVEAFVTEGKIVNDETIINKWVDLATNDFDGIKALLVNQPINKTSEKIETDVNTVENKPSYLSEKLKGLKK